MRRTQRLSANRCTSLYVCSALLSGLTLITPTSGKSGFVPQGRNDQANNGKVKKVPAKPPQPGAPAANLPNLDEARQRPQVEPRAPQSVASTVRSRRKPLESRLERKVGDALPRATPNPSPTAAPRQTPSPAASPRRNPSPSPSPTPTPSASGEAFARSLFSGGSYQFKDLLAKARLRALDHPALRFLNLEFSHGGSRSSSELASVRAKHLSDQASFDFLLPPAPQAGASKIVFATNRDGTMQIYSMNVDGSNLVRLTDSGANDDFPRWSPNGTKILFQSDRDHPDTGYLDIYVMNSDGSGVTRLTTDTNDDSMASWSPDGSKIVFQSRRNGANYQVYSMNADGSSQINLTNTSANDGEPSWSPDGSKIAFRSDRDHAGFSCIYSMNSNGANQQQLTFTSGEVADTQPFWSRDGNKIAFVSTRDSVLEQWQETDDFEIPEDDGQVITKSKLHLNKEVYVMNADGSGQTRLTNDLANDDYPSWSPDGSKIVFRSDRERDCCDPTAQVWTMNADGTNQTNFSNSGNGDYSASWTSGSSNQSPIANAGGMYNGILSQNVPFHGSSSYDPDGTIVSYSWNFGDGSTGSGVAPTHAYTAIGTYTVTLTVTDNLGAQGSVSTTVTISSSTSDQYAVNFLHEGLGRLPHSNDEVPYWTDIMRAAYAQGHPSMLLAMTEFGMTVFESAEYADRGRSDHEYVYDLYKTYLMREPDQEGWDFWTSLVPLIGRAGVRQTAMEDSSEFHNIILTLTASGNPTAAVSSLATAQVDLFNQSGNQVQARDCEFSVPLLSLPGRAGLDLGLSLSYSSLVWTRSGPYVYFDQDNESLSPGFTIGFPTVQWRKFDAQTSRNVYIFTAAGRHVELRQVGASYLYEAADSSYLQLTESGSSLFVLSTDGTRIEYENKAVGWVAKQIEDRNGNLITINNDWRGDIQNITDTLGRVIRFNYDGNANLISITQDGWSQPWATFGWGVTPAMQMPSGAQAVGTFNGDSFPVLSQVGLPDGSRFNFEYTGNAQVNVIRRYTYDPSNGYVQRSYSAYDYQGSGDCPRIYQARVWAENWTGVNGVPGEVVSSFSDNGDNTHQMTVSDGTIYKESYGGMGGSPVWQKGLVIGTEVRSGGVQQKLSTMSWTQDNTSANYKTNPRVTQTLVSDGSNTRKTTIDYSVPEYAQYGLPYVVREFAADATTVLRETVTNYNLSQQYLDQRIIGLVSAVHLVSNGYQAKVTYGYDDPARLTSQATDATMHDQGYHSNFTARGNVTSVSRWDVTDINNASKALTTTMNYNAAGSVVATTDPANHTSSIGYADSFADGNNGRGTFAYPTTLTDADYNSSFVQYDFSLGAKTRVQGPPPANQPNGIIQTFNYDSAARLQQVTTLNNNAYTRYVYGPNYTQSFTSVNNVADDAYSVQVFDGAGRVFESAAYHPGSQGGYRAVSAVYDAMGRLVKQSNPTEINGNWVPYSDDAAGWYFTQQTYDWKGRPLVTTHLADGSYKEASYTGCGCAGGEVVTLTDEGTLLNGVPQSRQQKIYSDVLGRQWKTEVLNWEGGSVYSTTVSVYSARDQVTRVKQYAGAAPIEASSTNESASCPTGTCQETLLTYDGYARLLTKHVPEQDAGTNTVYAYNNDDTISSVTDARGASATYGYVGNNRRLVTSISYQPAAGVPDTPDVGFQYDAAGNRTSMTDGFGTKTYTYNQLSQLMSETRVFSDPNNQSINGVSKTLSYDYNLAGELKKITDSTNMTIDYGYDTAGRLNGVTGSDTPYADVSNYASNFQYRAWGGLKSMTDGTNHVSSLAYDSKLQPTQFDISGNVVHQNYDYYDDGRISAVSNTTDANFDRGYSYDHLARLTKATSGGVYASPYHETFGYDALSNLTARYTSSWGQDEFSDSATYTGNKRDGWGYDADGRNTTIDTRTYAFDASGEMTLMTGQKWVINHYVATSQSAGYDGDGSKTKDTTSGLTTYYLKSSVMGGAIIEELNSSGQKNVGYVYAPGGRLLARQSANQVTWTHTTPAGTGKYEFFAGGGIGRTEFDPLGADVGLFAPNPPDTGGGQGDLGGVHTGGLMDSRYGNLANLGAGCTIDGVAASCSTAMGALSTGAGYEAVWATRYTTVKLDGKTIFSGYTAAGWVEASSIPFGYSRTTGEIPFSSLQQYSNQLGSANFWRSLFSGSINFGSSGSSYGPTSYSSDIGTHDVSSAYHVNIFGGAEYIASPQNTTAQTPCHVMADVAQNEANDALAQNPHNDRGALGVFDKRFSTLYVGGPFYDGYHAYRLRSGDQGTINRQYPISGGDGFRNEYKDSGYDPNPLIAGPKADQTHHFAAYLSLGINKASWTAWWGIKRDDNEGDVNLSRAAYRMGVQLHNRPSMLNRIGTWIRRTICDGPGHGLYY